MPQVVLIQPGATDYELQGRIHGDLDIPLCEEGRDEVGRVGRELQDLAIEVIYTSECSSAAETAAALGKTLGVKVKKLDRLENLDHGLWQGLLVDEVRQKQPKVYRQWLEQPETICPPEGETIDHARERIQGVLTKLLKKHADGVFGLVVPEPLASVVRSELCHTELGDLWRATCEHGCWTVINVGKNGEATIAAETVRNAAPQDRPEPAVATTNGHGHVPAGSNSPPAVEIAASESLNGTASHAPAEPHRNGKAAGRRRVQAEGAAAGEAHAADSLAPMPAQIFP